jgi:hypothetical protein
VGSGASTGHVHSPQLDHSGNLVSRGTGLLHMGSQEVRFHVEHDKI